MRGAREVRPTPVYGVLASGHGYMDLGRLERDQVGAAFEALAGTAALIFDVRGRTRETMESIAAVSASREALVAESGSGACDVTPRILSDAAYFFAAASRSSARAALRMLRSP